MSEGVTKQSLQGKAKYIVSEVVRFDNKAVHLKSGDVLNADILVTACEWLCAVHRFRTDL